MKTKIIFNWIVSIIFGIVFFSCSNIYYVEDDERVDNTELIPVSFSVGFTKEVTAFRSSEAPDVKDFFYLVYNTETGALYKGLTLYDFDGVVKDSLPEGDYTIVFAATIDGYLSVTSANIKFKGIYYPSLEFLTDSYFNKYHDVFYKQINHVVEKNNQNDKSVTLDRIVGRTEIVLEDIIPSEVSTMEIVVDSYPEKFCYSLDADFTTASGVRKNLIISESERVTSGYTIFFDAFENINFNQSRYPVSIQLIAHKTLPEGVVDTGQSIVAQKEISNVDVLKNRIVRYTGKLFDNINPPDDEDPESSFSIIFNEEWGETIDKTF